MSIPTLSFFNNKGGVGKTTLVHHFCWMMAELGIKTLVVDCDPQANLTASFISDEDVMDFLSENPSNQKDSVFTIFNSVAPLLDGTGDIAEVKPLRVTENLRLIAGDLRLSIFEDELSLQWSQALGESANRRAMLVLSAFWRMAQNAARKMTAQLIVFDVGPNLGGINRSVLIGTDHVIVPLAADLYSIQGLRNLGPAIKKWNQGWQRRLDNLEDDGKHDLPTGTASPLGYIAMQYQQQLSRPVKAYAQWLNRIPQEYRESLSLSDEDLPTSVQSDPACLAMLRHYKSLMPMAQEARKPVFLLKSADGAIGSHFASVQQAYKDFEQLAKKIVKKLDILRPENLNL